MILLWIKHVKFMYKIPNRLTAILAQILKRNHNPIVLYVLMLVLIHSAVVSDLTRNAGLKV